jgi:diadenosine tetraphosphate (Ap4A) HIT family hydrolase
MSGFVLDSRLESDTVFLFDWPLCRVVLMNDAHYPWCILIPRVVTPSGDQVTELYHLDDAQRAQLDKESNVLSTHLMERFDGDKLNIAALGNVVAQLHIHHVVRFKIDAAWPAPVWGKFAATPYEATRLEALRSGLVDSLAKQFA